MENKSVITISGVPGSGTTTITKQLSKKLQLPIVNTGDIFRELANEHDMGLVEFGKYVESNADIDEELDKRQLKYAHAGNVILEGRLAGWLMKANKIKAFTIFLKADLEVRIERVMGRENKSYAQVKSEVLAREKCELDRFKKLYNVNYQDESIYDLIIQTSKLSPQKIVEKILDGLTEAGS